MCVNVLARASWFFQERPGHNKHSIPRSLSKTNTYLSTLLNETNVADVEGEDEQQLFHTFSRMRGHAEQQQRHLASLRAACASSQRDDKLVIL